MRTYWHITRDEIRFLKQVKKWAIKLNFTDKNSEKYREICRKLPKDEKEIDSIIEEIENDIEELDDEIKMYSNMRDLI
jgi:DNA-binding transcriptional regulator GbsR (MarR family)